MSERWEHPVKAAENAEVARYPQSGGNLSLTPGEHDSRLRQAFQAGAKAGKAFALGKLPLQGTDKKATT